MADDRGWDGRVGQRLADIRAAGRWRQPRTFDAADAVAGRVEGRSVVSFASNDYLGLSHHPQVVAAAHEALDRWGAGAGAARLIVGSRPVHDELEAALAAWKGTEDAVLFPTGFAANLGVLATLGTAGVTVLSDELNHASIIDGCRLARADVRVYRHADLDHLAKLLADAAGPALVVTDTVFSMDGDAVDLPALVDLVAAHDALLVLDEAHAVLGPELPTPAAAGGTGQVPVLRVGTLSKTLGSLGGFVAAPKIYADLLRNAARPYIFTTASTPADMAAALAAVRIVTSPEGDALRATLRRHVDRLRPGHPSPIIPVVLGDEATAVAAARELEEQGLLVPAIRPPTVPPGTCRLRVALSAAHTDDQVERLAAALAAPGPLDALGPDPGAHP
ncbi:MAG TPA: 8-amino-7-oxononanoate synthase [Acidimicrobiales bacterium]